jgi:hypothetical protein
VRNVRGLEAMFTSTCVLASIPTKSTMNPTTTLIASHAWPGFIPSNINHEPCHHTDGVTRMLASTQANSCDPIAQGSCQPLSKAENRADNSNYMLGAACGKRAATVAAVVVGVRGIGAGAGAVRPPPQPTQPPTTTATTTATTTTPACMVGVVGTITSGVGVCMHRPHSLQPDNIAVR